ncbi:MAG: hypothetical protein RBR08_16110 [Desulforegulaceae bacterium]|nr:hypothetical protein [Desulforegulaceae bacterium]
MTPELPTRLGKTTRTKSIAGHPIEFTVIDEDIFIAPSNPEKAFCLHKIKFTTGEVEFRIGYYMIGHRPRMEGKWAWGQYAPIMTAEEMQMIFDRVRDKGWI